MPRSQPSPCDHLWDRFAQAWANTQDRPLWDHPEYIAAKELLADCLAEHELPFDDADGEMPPAAGDDDA
jgi:hypothetical protein